MTMIREDGNQSLQSIRLKMPPGLLGTLANVKLCGEPQADAGACGEESLIGETTVSVGLGGDPYRSRAGRSTSPAPTRARRIGCRSCESRPLASARSISAPVMLVVRAKIEVNQETAQLTITTDPSGPYAIPHILDGIPLQIKHVNVTINRPGFTFNPTNCNPLQLRWQPGQRRRHERGAVGAVPGHQLCGALVQTGIQGLYKREDLAGGWREPACRR